MPLPLTLCDAGHQAIAFLGDCPLCPASSYERPHGRKRIFSTEVSKRTLQVDLEAALKARYAGDADA